MSAPSRFPRFGVALPALCVSAGLLTVPSSAEAHGRFPQAGQVVVDPNDEDRIFVRTTYGATLTTDGGATWYWLCPESIGFNSDQEDPPVVILADGTVVAGTFGGLSVSHDFGCDFVREGGDLAGRFFVDVQTTADFEGGVAVSSNGLGSFAFDVRLWESSDGAASWSGFGTAPPEDFLGLSLGVAGSDPTRLYLTGRDGTAADALSGVLFRTDDRGESWQRLAVPNATPPSPDVQILPYIGAVSADDPDTLFIGLVTTEGSNVVTHFELMVSTDGAMSWESVFEADDAVTGFALSPDGATVALGGPKLGLYTAPITTLAFSKVNEVRVGCLSWMPSGLYACADEFVDQYTLGVSRDEGVTFEPLARLGSPCGPPPTCGADTSTGRECVSRWPQEQLELNAGDCEADGGAGGTPITEPSSGSCGCRVPPHADDASATVTRALLFGLFGVVLLGGRRATERRRRR